MKRPSSQAPSSFPKSLYGLCRQKQGNEGRDVEKNGESLRGQRETGGEERGGKGGMAGRGEAKKRKGKVTRYTEHQGNTLVGGGGKQFQPNVFLSHARFTGQRQGDYSIWKKKNPRSRRVTCVLAAPPGIPPRDPCGMGSAHFPRQRSNSP